MIDVLYRLPQSHTLPRNFIRYKNNSDLELQIDLINDIAPHYGNFENGSTLGKIDKSAEMLGYKPTMNVEMGIRKFIEWYKSYYGK